MEHLNRFISSRGILKSCDIHNLNPTSSSNEIDIDLVNFLPENPSIYICTDAIFNFSESFAPKIVKPFTLVTGDSDLAIDINLIKTNSVQKLLENKFLNRWFAQNKDVEHEKIHYLPIGLDFHTIANNPRSWSLSKSSPIAQESCLLNIFKLSKDIEKRYLSCYCNWQFELQRGDRQECMEKIDKRAVFLELTRMPRLATWTRQSEFMFVISPEGAGMDCHRTWESLLLGNIPIVKKNSLSNNYQKLPILVVSDWSEVTENFLLESINEIINKKYDFSSLFLQFWVKKIHGKKMDILETMTLNEFKSLMTFQGG